MKKEELIQSIIHYFHKSEPLKLCSISNGSFEIAESDKIEREDYYNIRFINKENSTIDYFPNNKSLLYCFDIEMNIVKELYSLIENNAAEEEIEQLKIQMMCDFNSGCEFYNNGIYIVEHARINEENNFIKVSITANKYIFNGELVKTNELKNYFINYNIKDSSVIDNFDSSMQYYFSDSNYSFFSIISALILLGQERAGLNVKRKIEQLIFQFKEDKDSRLKNELNSCSFHLRTTSFESSKILLFSREYYIDYLYAHILLEDKHPELNFELFKLSINELAVHFKITLTESLRKLVFEDLYNIIHIKKLESLGFEKRYIYTLLKSGCIFDGVYTNKVFNKYLSYLPKKSIVRKLVKEKNANYILIDIENMLQALPDYNINVDISLRKLEEEITIEYNKNLSSKENSNIDYDLPNIDYSRSEFTIYEKDYYSLRLPLTINCIKSYGKLLKNCAGTYTNKVLDKEAILLSIYKDETIIGLARLSPDFSKILEAKAKANTKIKPEVKKFILDFCQDNHIQIYTSDLIEEEVA